MYLKHKLQDQTTNHFEFTDKDFKGTKYNEVIFEFVVCFFKACPVKQINNKSKGKTYMIEFVGVRGPGNKIIIYHM